MPNRILKESICTSDNIDRLTAEEETFFYRLIVHCDDFGLMDARDKILRSKLYPLRTDAMSLDTVRSHLQALKDAELIRLYVIKGRLYLQMLTWEKHQQQRAKKPKYPLPEEGSIVEGRFAASDSNGNQMLADDGTCPRNPIQSNPNPIQSNLAREKSHGARAPKKLSANQEIWKALIDAGLPKPDTETECSLWGAKTTELGKAGVTPSEAADLVRRYRQMWPDATCTITAIVKHVSDLRAWNGQVNGHARAGPNGRAVDRSPMAQSDETPEQLQARLDRMNERLLKRGQASSPDGSGDSAIRAPQTGSGDVPRPAVAFGGSDPRPANGRAHLSRVPPGL